MQNKTCLELCKMRAWRCCIRRTATRSSREDDTSATITPTIEDKRQRLRKKVSQKKSFDEFSIVFHLWRLFFPALAHFTSHLTFLRRSIALAHSSYIVGLVDGAASSRTDWVRVPRHRWKICSLKACIENVSEHMTMIMWDALAEENSFLPFTAPIQISERKLSLRVWKRSLTRAGRNLCVGKLKQMCCAHRAMWQSIVCVEWLLRCEETAVCQ